MTFNYYEVLGVDEDVDLSDLKKAYRQAAFKYHPDANIDGGGDEEKFKQVSEAYAVLSDESKRSDYDRYGDEYSEYDEAGGYGESEFHRRYSEQERYHGTRWQDVFTNPFVLLIMLRFLFKIGAVIKQRRLKLIERRRKEKTKERARVAREKLRQAKRSKIKKKRVYKKSDLSNKNKKKASEKGFGKGWFGQSERHSKARRKYED